VRDYYPDSTWATALVGGSHEFLANGARLLDARAMMHYVGTGSQYAFTARDASGAWLDGGRDYTFTLPAGIPPRPSWPSTSTTPRHARCCRPTTRPQHPEWIRRHAR